MAEITNILDIPTETGYWLVRADGGKYYDDFFLNNFISISDNEISLESIKQTESLTGITIEHYKNLYINEYNDWNSQQISHAANRTFKFIENMKIGDIVLVPSNKSKHFLIGIIESDPYEINDDVLVDQNEVHYSINPFLKRRKIKWLKEVNRGEISEKLYWILSAHQTIFDLEKEKEYINQLLAPIYCLDGVFHSTLKISKNEGLNSSEWYQLHSLINFLVEDSDEEVIIKTNVQSPGLLEFVTTNPSTAVSLTVILSGVIFGEVNFLGIKLVGIVPFYQSFKKGKIEILRGSKEIELMDEEKTAKQMENDKAQFELEKEKYLWENKKIEMEAEKIRNQLQISNFDAGRVFEHQTQTDTSYVQNED